jgi:hypothetical protein
MEYCADSDSRTDADCDAESDGRIKLDAVNEEGLSDSWIDTGRLGSPSETLEGVESHATESVMLPELSLRGDSGRSNSTTAGRGAWCITTSSVGSAKSCTVSAGLGGLVASVRTKSASFFSSSSTRSS